MKKIKYIRDLGFMLLLGYLSFLSAIDKGLIVILLTAGFTAVSVLLVSIADIATIGKEHRLQLVKGIAEQMMDEIVAYCNELQLNVLFDTDPEGLALLWQKPSDIYEVEKICNITPPSSTKKDNVYRAYVESVKEKINDFVKAHELGGTGK